jgi:hypothetical protein
MPMLILSKRRRGPTRILAAVFSMPRRAGEREAVMARFAVAGDAWGNRGVARATSRIEAIGSPPSASDAPCGGRARAFRLAVLAEAISDRAAGYGLIIEGRENLRSTAADSSNEARALDANRAHCVSFIGGRTPRATSETNRSDDRVTIGSESIGGSRTGAITAEGDLGD